MKLQYKCYYEDTLAQIILTSQDLEHPLAFSAIYPLAFFSFLRLSNMVPHSTSTFDVSRHFADGYVIFSHDMAIILVKWSQTNQFRNKVVSISIPSLLCPVAALKALIQTVPGAQDDPLFSILNYGKYVPLTDSMVRMHWKKLINILD